LSNRRILYTAFDVVPSPKGASTHITYFTRGLINAGYDVMLITAGDHDLPETDTYEGATLLRAPETGDNNFLKRALNFGEYIAAHIDQSPPFDLAHVRDVWGGFPLMNLSGGLNCPLLFEVNGLPSIEMKYHYPALSDTPVIGKIKERERATLQFAAAIICVSQVTRAYLASLGLDPAKITVIPNGVDTDAFTPTPPRPFADIPELLYIGTLADWQGLQTAILALPLIVAQQPVRLRIVGRARKRHRKLLTKMARKLGVEACLSIEEAIPPSEIPALIAGADICIAPLGYNDRNVTQGCCPLKVLEYMAAGRPLVASNLPVVRELIRDDRDALLFQPNSPDDLARAVLKLLNQPDLAHRLAQNAAEHVRQNFTWKGAQQKLLAVYEDLLSR
jgi:glycosyltransferase involved in cell wall biosynthesis